MNAPSSLSSQQLLQAPNNELVWHMARAVPGYDPNELRKDDFGWLIRKSDYGNKSSEFGWELDDHYLSSLSGSGTVLNMRPLHWRNNLRKSDILGIFRLF